MKIITIGVISGLILIIAGLTLLIVFSPKVSLQNPYPPYICHSNVSNTTNITSICYKNPQYQDWQPALPPNFYIFMEIFYAGFLVILFSSWFFSNIV